MLYRKIKNSIEKIKKVKNRVLKKSKSSNNKKIKIAFFEIEGWERNLINDNLKDFNTEINISKDLAKPGDYEVLSIFIYSKIDKKFIDSCPNLKLIVTRSAGLDHIDLEYARSKGIVVKNCPSYGPHSVAEFSFLLILAVIRKFVKALDEEYNFKSKDYDLRGYELKSKKIAIIGTGKIGSAAAEIALGFGMEVLAYDKFPKENLIKKGVKYGKFEEIIKEADIIGFYVPLLPETKHMLNRKNIKYLKKGVFIVNVSRGPVIELEAIIEGLEKGIISGIALDVIEGEKTLKICENKSSLDLKNDSKEELLKFAELMELMHKFRDKVIITPHIAYNTWESVENIWQTSLDHIKEYLNSLDNK